MTYETTSSKKDAYREGWDSISTEEDNTGARLEDEAYEAGLDDELRMRPERSRAEADGRT